MDVVAIVLVDGLAIAGTDSFDVSYLQRFEPDKSRENENLNIGDQLFALGYPYAMHSRRNHFPIAKAGYLASLPGEEFQLQVNAINRNGQPSPAQFDGKIYLVDGLIVPGNSGGPVVKPSEIQIRLNPQSHNFEYSSKPTENRIVGIVSQTATAAGLSVVYSSDYFLDLIDEFDKDLLKIDGNILTKKD